MSISVICACKNRSDTLKVTLNSWLTFKEIDEIIIVDWSSDEPIDYLTKIDERIKIIRVSNQKYFNQPQPLNLAASLAKGEYILKLDTDYLLNPYFNFIEKYFPGEDSFVSGVHNIENPEFYDDSVGVYKIDTDKMSIEQIRDYVYSYSPYFKYLTGLLFISKKNFEILGGYNENLTKYYAFEDTEIFERLKVLGLNELKLTMDYTITHLPHPDKKRTENFEGFLNNQEPFNYLRDNLSSYYSGEELEWQTEYAFSQMHINENKKMIGEINYYYVEPKTKWNITKIDEQNYFAEMMVEKNNNKLYGIPSVYYVSLEECHHRRKEIENQFKKYDINPKSIISKRFFESDDKVEGKYIYQLNDGTKGCCVSHLKAIKKWYEDTEEDYGFFCEDDLSLDTVEHWNFSWEEFIENLPEDAECVQLFTIRGEYDTYELRERYWDDWGATAYIMTRDYAKKVIDTYIKDDAYSLEVPNQDVMPLIENILFASVGKTYTIPLFVENIDFNSTFENQDNDVNDGQKRNHKVARERVLEHWKNKNSKPKVQKTLEKNNIENFLTQYSLDTEDPENNFNLGLWYENEGHTAPALSYFLRCAERAEDKDLAYEALIRGSFCYEKQKERDGSARSLLFQAQAFNPERPEAYFLLSRYARLKEWWQDAYINSHLALLNCDFNQQPLRTNVEYPGKHGLLFEKSLAGWWWGKVDESRDLLQQILNEYHLDESSYNHVWETLSQMGVEVPRPKTSSSEFSFGEEFDWSSLSYEDMITIDREIVHEKVYRFWNDVKEGDVVLDVGASVGAFSISILDQKPKKVYCVEPSKKLLKTLAKNCSEKVFEYSENPLVYINKGIVDKEGDKINIFGGEEEFSGITFETLIKDYNIQKVDYMKIDCEGGEYSIFKEENMNFLKNNVKFIAAEIHLNYEGCREKFKNFRDKYLTQFENYKVMSCTRQNISWGNSIDIKDRIFDNNFIDEYTCEFMIYIFNGELN